MNTIEKINCWAKAAKAAMSINKISDEIKNKIPLDVRKDIYIRTVVEGMKQYHKELKRYAKKHKL